ncbi:hypothetical protein GCM10009096_13400 [Parasphingorhabdus litoris]|uniref:Tetratricopeptide repeat protein n=1 Tax=Parasphingorhabdus litoris TaxID=394733 RepID=A0ABN1ACX0_9SPHN|nr:putative 2OG-Fe(II) oxygenase [Parasphingorhabdus litoris]
MSYSKADQILRDDAIAAYQSGRHDALHLLKEARSRLPFDGGLLISEAGALLADNDPKALHQLTAVLDQAPDWVDGQSALARYRFEYSDPDYLNQLEKALAVLPYKSALWRLYMQFLTDGNEPLRAADIARMLRQKGAPANDLALLEARYAGLAGHHDRADRLFQQLPNDWPAKILDEARHRLRQADGEAADHLLSIPRKREPDSVVIWALTEICWRLMEDPRHSWLLPEKLLPIQIDLRLDSKELETLTKLLPNFHYSRSRPLNQSVRSGTQTRGNLFLRQDTEILKLKKLFLSAIRGYQSAWPEIDPEHPTLRYRNTEIGLVAGWSILVGPLGHHVSHVHDGGLISSACHIAVPEPNGDNLEQGILELGRPPKDIPLDLMPLRQFTAKVGHLVLFPSFLYHGTRPIEHGERLTIAFDAAADRDIHI